MGVRPRICALATENADTFFLAPASTVVGGTLLQILLRLRSFPPIRGARGAVGENWKLRFTNRSVRRRTVRFVNRSVRVLIEESYFVQEKTNKKTALAAGSAFRNGRIVRFVSNRSIHKINGRPIVDSARSPHESSHQHDATRCWIQYCGARRRHCAMSYVPIILV